MVMVTILHFLCIQSARCLWELMDVRCTHQSQPTWEIRSFSWNMMNRRGRVIYRLSLYHSYLWKFAASVHFVCINKALLWILESWVKKTVRNSCAQIKLHIFPTTAPFSSFFLNFGFDCIVDCVVDCVVASLLVSSRWTVRLAAPGVCQFVGFDPLAVLNTT